MRPSDDDYEEDDRPRQKKKDNPLLIVLLVAAGVMVLSAIVVGVPLLMRVAQIAPGAPAQPKLATRAEFRKAVMGKTPDEVIRAVGKPDKTSDSGRTLYWYFYERTRDEVTGNTDGHVQVVIEDGHVTDVNY